MKRLCVFLGSSTGDRPEHAAMARDLAREMTRRSLDLVYGGGHVGLMGVLADDLLAAGREVIGVIPQGLAAREVAHKELTELHVVDTMHARKALMAAQADAFLALPGGFGTLEEFFEVLTWLQLGIHGKPCGLLNGTGYFTGLLAFLDHVVDEGFARAGHRDLIHVGDTPAAILDKLTAAPPARGPDWITEPLRP